MKINVKNIEKIKEVLGSVENGCSARTFNESHIPGVITNAEKKLRQLEIPKKYWVGCKIECEPPKLPNTYKYKGEGTYVTIKRFASAWFVVRIGRFFCHTKPFGSAPSEYLNLSDLAKDNMPSRYEI